MKGKFFLIILFLFFVELKNTNGLLDIPKINLKPIVQSATGIVNDLAQFTLNEILNFRSFKSLFNKVYATIDLENIALLNFLINQRDVEEHNKKYEKGLVPYNRAVCEFSDMSTEDMNRYVNRFHMPNIKRNRRKRKTKGKRNTVPEEVGEEGNIAKLNAEQQNEAKVVGTDQQLEENESELITEESEIKEDYELQEEESELEKDNSEEYQEENVKELPKLNKNNNFGKEYSDYEEKSTVNDEDENAQPNVENDVIGIEEAIEQDENAGTEEEEYFTENEETETEEIADEEAEIEDFTDTEEYVDVDAEPNYENVENEKGLPKLPVLPENIQEKEFVGAKKKKSNALKLSIESKDDILNYVTEGFKNPVLNQGVCGSCWSFSAAAAIEAAWFIKTGELIKLSEQQLIDCNKNFENDGCEGGNMATAFSFIENYGGIALNSRYPYKGNDTYKCKNVSPDIEVFSHEIIDPGDEDLLLEMLIENGPIAVAVDASLKSFQTYKSGIYYDPKCSERVNHAMLLVGYGTVKKTKQDYWILKNTYGKTWGIDGYMKLSRNRDNHCGITEFAAYPICS